MGLWQQEDSMVIGWSQAEQQSSKQASGSAWTQVEAVQRQLRFPCRLIPQPAHAVLAGEIAADLTCFGQLPPDIIRAIQMHDTGWAASDAHQIQRLRAPNAAGQQPVSFLSISPRETEEAWIASIESVAAFSANGAKVVSRHFTLLAQHDPVQHRHFLNSSHASKSELKPDIEGWTAALGVCDLISLYLVCGLTREVEFPLAHPASPHAQNTPRVKMHLDGEQIRFTPEAVLAGKTWMIHSLRHPVPTHGPRTETMTWTVQ
jgi:Protein of unknown function (DUF3891)